jgi:hypothetical protein
MRQRTFPYGDGHAAPRIATIIERWLERREPLAISPLQSPQNE